MNHLMDMVTKVQSLVVSDGFWLSLSLIKSKVLSANLLDRKQRPDR